MIEGNCHCGAVRIELPAAPQKITLCNCSICRRTGALWGYYPATAVRIHGHPDQTQGYIWGDRTLATVRCRHCGCVTHWQPLQPNSDGRMGVNMRNFDPALLADATLRRFDGAVSWTYVD
jgi:hypothetical protein